MRVIVALSSNPQARIKELQAANKKHFSTTKEKFKGYSSLLSDRLGVRASFILQDRTTAGGNPKYHIVVKANYGKGKNVVIDATFSTKVSDKALTQIRYATESTIAINATKYIKKFGPFCTKVLGKPAVSVVQFAKVIKIFAAGAEGSALVKVPSGKDLTVGTTHETNLGDVSRRVGEQNLKSAEIASDLRRAGIKMKIERYGMGGFGQQSVYRPVPGQNPGYIVTQKDGKYIVLQCRGPGNPSTPEFTKKVKMFAKIEQVAAFLNSMKQ